jgi:hypothetical protein
MLYKRIDTNIFDCSTCPTRCDGKSKLNYQFEDDVSFAEIQEELVRNNINKNQDYKAYKTTQDGYPDVEIYYKGNLHRYLEVKAQRRTFMIVEKLLPQSNLTPSETLALNLSDLERYFTIEEKTGIPTSIVWVLMNRPCLVNDVDKKFYYQTTTELKKIYLKYKNKRRFRRKSGEGDMVDGVHKGVTVNYHFSINELLEWNI